MTARRRPDATTLITMAISFPSLWLAFGIVGGIWVRLDPLGFAVASIILAAALAAPFIFISTRLPGWLRFGLISSGVAWVIGAAICEYFQIDPTVSTSFSSGTGL